MIVGDRTEEMAAPMAEAQAWIEACTGKPFDKELGEATAISTGSAGVMERSDVSKGGITFGNDAAGAGSA